MHVPPLAAVAAMWVIGPMIGGPAVAYGLARVPEAWRRTATWAVLLAAVLAAVAADLSAEGPIDGMAIYVLAALPGTMAYLAWRTLLASVAVSLAPMYFLLAIAAEGRRVYTPAVWLDAAIPLAPGWMLVYGSLYVFVVLLPLLVVRSPALIRRGLKAYLTVMLVAYTGFLLYPTIAPRPASVAGDGFAAWSLRLAYDIDTPYNCFPSLHVAYSFVAALLCLRVHRGVGAVALVWASLIGVSTVYTKQHYGVDVLAGAVIAVPAYAVFLRGPLGDPLSERDRRRAPARALMAAAAYAAVVMGFWIAYALNAA